MPAESANGRFAINAMQTVPINDARQVARSTAVPSMPVVESTEGFTARIYAIVINVVIPAATSVLTFVLFFLSLNIFSIISFITIRLNLYILLYMGDYGNIHRNRVRIL